MGADLKPHQRYKWVQTDPTQTISLLGPRRHRIKGLVEAKDGLLRPKMARSVFKFNAEDGTLGDYLSYPVANGLQVATKPVQPMYYSRRYGKCIPVGKDTLIGQTYWEECSRLHRSPAGRKAVKLLKEFLNEQQRADLDKKGFFKVIRDEGKRGVYEFLIEIDPNFGCFMYVGKRLVPEHGWMSFCWHPEQPVPNGDLALIHYLQIEDRGPESLLDAANW